VQRKQEVRQLDLFTDYETARREEEAEAARCVQERRLQHTLLAIRGKYGKNAILKGMNLLEGATAADRNGRIGGHKA